MNCKFYIKTYWVCDGKEGDIATIPMDGVEVKDIVPTLEMLKDPNGTKGFLQKVFKNKLIETFESY